MPILVMLLAAFASAHGLLAAPPRLDLAPVEQGVEDVSPIAHSLRYVDPRATQAPHFDQLWQLRGTGYFIRIEGAVHAVFPQSDYRFTAAGIEPLVPPGTVFYLEPPTHLLSGPGGAEQGLEQRLFLTPQAPEQYVAGTMISNRVSARLDRYVRDVDGEDLRGLSDAIPLPRAAPVPPSSPRPSVQSRFDGEAERARAQRVAQLVRLALAEPTSRRE